jgi:hypothetical protein
MGTKLRTAILSTLLAGLAATAVLVAPVAEARRGPTTTTTTVPSYVPPIENPYDDPSEDFTFESPFEDPSQDPLDDSDTLGGVLTDPSADPAGSGDVARPAPGDTPAIEPVSLPVSGTHPGAEDRSRGGILSRTGAETMPLVRAGLAAVALGGGLGVLGRRRRAGVARSEPLADGPVAGSL